MPIAIVAVMVMSGLYGVLFFIDEPAQGATSLGTITVTGGSKRSFSGVDYLLDGDITVSGSGSKVTFADCTLTLTQDVGSDGEFGGGDDHIYTISVQSGGEIEFTNTHVTTQTGQLHPYFDITITGDGSGSKISFKNSIIEGPGTITMQNSALLEASGSVFMELNDKSNLKYDIDGDGSSEDDEDVSDDGPRITFNSGARGLIVDSELRDTMSFSSASRNGMTAANITLDGTNTNVTFINSFLDVDFETSLSTGTHNMLRITNGAVAHIVSCAFNVSSATTSSPAISVSGTGSRAIYYRWIAAHVKDGMGIRMEAQSVTVHRVEGNTNRRLGSSYLTTELLNYIGKNSLNWNTTSQNGWAFLPVATDIITVSTMPNSDTYPDFIISVTRDGETVSSTTSFKNYPKVPDQGEVVGIINDIVDGSADPNHGFSDLGGPLSFSKFVIDPSTSSYFSGLGVDLTINSRYTLTGTSSFIDGVFYPSFYAFDGHLLVRSGGHLVINDTFVRFLTDDSPAYILIENGGKLELNNVSLSGYGDKDLYLYILGSSNPTVIMSEGSMMIEHMVARDTAKAAIEASVFNGSLNLFGSSVDVSVHSNALNIPNVYAVDCTLDLGGGPVQIDDLDWSGVDFTSTDSVFSIPLDVDGTAVLTNVTFSGSLPDGRTKWLKALGTGSIQRGWWLNARVEDSVQNPLAGAAIDVQRVEGPLNIDVATYTTDSRGEAKFPLVQEEIRSTGRTYLGNYRMNASFSGISSSPQSAVLSGADVDALILVPGGPNLVPKMIWTQGTMIDGFSIDVKGSISNEGEFASAPFMASLVIDGEVVAEEMMTGLNSGATAEIKGTWLSLEGESTFSLVVDTLDEVRETNEVDNTLEQLNVVGLGPDYTLVIDLPDDDWAYNTFGQFDIIVANGGDLDPEENGFIVNITWGSGQGSGFVAMNLTFDYIPPGEEVRRTVNWTPQDSGVITVVGIIDSKYDRSPLNSIQILQVDVLSLADLGLVINSFAVDSPDPVTTNTMNEVSFTVVNTGDLPAGQFIVALFDGEEEVDTNVMVPGLKPEEEIEISFDWFSGAPGIHNLTVKLDLGGMVMEQFKENNNVTFSIRVDTEPDLTFTSNIGVSPRVVTEGKNVTIWATVINDGRTMARNAKVQFSLDSDTNVLSTLEVNLLPGQMKNLSIVWKAAGTGFHTIFVVADPFDQIFETIELENNNLRSVDLNVLSKPDLFMNPPDLRVEPSSMINIGDEVAIQATIRNSGETDANNVFIRFYDGDPIQGGKIISWKETQPSVSINKIPAGGSKWANVTWTPMVGGYHSIYVVMDLVNAIDESDESNNKVSWEVYVLTLPDMAFSDLTLYQGEFEVDSAGVGSTLRINATVTNLGDTMAPSFRIRFFNGDYQNDPDPIPIGMGMTYFSGILAGKDSMSIEMPWTVDYPKGIRTISVQVDILEGEEQTTNNNRIFSQIEVFDIQDVPELMTINESLMLNTGYSGMEIDLDNEPTGYVGMNLSVQVNITNIGGISASNTTISFIASNETMTWVEFNTTIGFIENNGTDIINGFWNLRSTGVNRLRIIIDPDNNIREFDEGNNVRIITIDVQEAPDVSIEVVREGSAYNSNNGKFEMKKNSEYELTFNVINRGDFEFSNLLVEFESSWDLAPGESPTRTINLGPGDSMRVSFKVKPTSSPGEILYWDCIVNGDNQYYESDTGNDRASVDVEVLEAEQESLWWLWIIIIILILLLIAGIAGYFVYKKMQTKDMAKCSNCGGLVAMDDNICPHCGVEFSEEFECECGEVLKPGMTECPACHKPVAGVITAPKDQEGEKKEGEEEEEMEEVSEEEIEEMEEETTPPAMEEPEEVTPEDMIKEAPTDEEELAECFECGALIPVSAPICPHCGAVFE
ncbi:MAG: CARDB domain-containing protein [Thermoplasmatota archaeon]